MMPVAWILTYTGSEGKPARIFTTTMGSAQDLLNDGLRWLLVKCLLLASRNGEDSRAVEGRIAPAELPNSRCPCTRDQRTRQT